LERRSPPRQASSEFERGDESILIVEDDALVREYVVAQISRLGYDTLAASNGAEALAIINGPERIDLLFDVIMPGSMNGRQPAIEPQKRRPELKVLFTSGYTENAIVHHGRLDPGVLLPKPLPQLRSRTDDSDRAGIVNSGQSVSDCRLACQAFRDHCSAAGRHIAFNDIDAKLRTWLIRVVAASAEDEVRLFCVLRHLIEVNDALGTKSSRLCRALLRSVT
jgi:CheY-like chemotaxis protein